MMYQKKSLHLQNPLSFWLNFPGHERLFWYDTQHDKIVVGAGRLASLTDESQCKDYDFAFYSRSFFDQAKGERWKNFGNEIVAFANYYIVDGDQSYILYHDQCPQIVEKPIPTIRHDYHENSDDYLAWEALFKEIKEQINRGKVTKVVASREAQFTCPSGFHIASILQNLIRNNEGSFIFAYEKEGKTFLGASPEVLVEKRNSHIMSYALAGTCARDDVNNPNAAAQLLEDTKNVYEHSLVTNMIIDTMKSVTPKVQPDDMGIMILKNLYHLRTIVRAEDDSTSLIEWGNKLHPTPAMGGSPNKAAMALIRNFEGHERGLYASPIGIIKSDGNGMLIVGIRSALIEGNQLYAYAGCGIVEQSDSQEEYKESKNKLRTILEAL